MNRGNVYVKRSSPLSHAGWLLALLTVSWFDDHPVEVGDYLTKRAELHALSVASPADRAWRVTLCPAFGSVFLVRVTS